MNPYWADLVRLLLVFRYKKYGNISDIRKIRDDMESEMYAPLINRYAGLGS